MLVVLVWVFSTVVVFDRLDGIFGVVDARGSW